MSCGWRGGAPEDGRERGGWWRGLSGEFDIIVACAWCDVAACVGGGGGQGSDVLGSLVGGERGGFAVLVGAVDWTAAN